MKIIFKKLVDLLKEIEELKWIDLDKGQLEYYNTRPAVAFPCALIKIDLTKCENLGRGWQQCSCSATIRLAFDYTGETSEGTPEPVLESSLAYFDLAEKIYKKLQGYSDKQISPFNRKNMREETRRDGLKVLLMPFETEFVDKTAQRT